MINVADTLIQNSAYLQPNSSARLDAELLLAHCLGVDRTALFREPERLISPTEQKMLSTMVAERKKGRPIAQLIGKVEFFSLEFKINESVLSPRAETELLVEQTLAVVSKEPLRIIDLGTGSGAIAISIATHCPNAIVYAVELCGRALAVAQANQQSHHLENLHLIRAGWLSAIANDSIDIVISNPPYIESDDPHLLNTDIRFEPKLALDGGPDGMSAYRTLLGDIPRVLKSSGRVLLEHGYQQGSNLRELLASAGFTQVKTFKDLAGHDRVVSGVFQHNPPAR